MNFEAFTLKWFSFYYAIFGLLLAISGLYLAMKPSDFNRYLQNQTKNEDPPHLIRKILKYLFYFTIPCLVLSFFPFSWPELLFSIWSLLIVYLTGSQLVRWSQLCTVIREKESQLNRPIRWLGAILLSAAVVIFLLDYLVMTEF